MNSRSDRMAILVLAGEGFFGRLSFSMMGFALPLYARHLGMSLSEVGVLVSLNVAVAMALKPVLGGLADHFGWRRSAIAGVGLRSFVPLLLAGAWLPWQLYGIRAVHGLSEAVRDPSVKTLLAVHAGKEQVASAFGWYATSRTVGASLGHAIAGILLTVTASNFSLVFAAACVLSLLPLFCVIRYFPKTDRQQGAAAEIPTENSAASVSASAAPPKRPNLVSVMGLGFSINAASQMLHGLFPVLATEYAGLSAAQTGIVYAISTCIVLFAGPLFGWLSDHVSRELVLLVRGAANILSSAVYLAAPNFPGVTVARCVDDLGKAAYRPAWGAMMAMVSGFDHRRRARTIGLASTGEDAGDIVGPILAGFLWQTWGIAVVLAVRMALAAAAEIYALSLGRKLHAYEAAEGQRSYPRQLPGP